MFIHLSVVWDAGSVRSLSLLHGNWDKDQILTIGQRTILIIAISKRGSVQNFLSHRAVALFTLHDSLLSVQETCSRWGVHTTWLVGNGSVHTWLSISRRCWLFYLVSKQNSHERCNRKCSNAMLIFITESLTTSLLCSALLCSQKKNKNTRLWSCCCHCCVAAPITSAFSASPHVYFHWLFVQLVINPARYPVLISNSESHHHWGVTRVFANCFILIWRGEQN